MKKKVTRVAIVCDADGFWYVRRIMKVAHEVSLNIAPLGADTSQQQFLTTPQHA
jgi:hypothetical protein